MLVDAPCSGIGTWSRNPDARWRIQPEDVKEKAVIQAGILKQAARSVRTGGKLVYAVCTITKAETVDVIEQFLEDHYALSQDIEFGIANGRFSILQTRPVTTRGLGQIVLAREQIAEEAGIGRGEP